jgi:hypothetical protein
MARAMEFDAYQAIFQAIGRPEWMLGASVSARVNATNPQGQETKGVAQSPQVRLADPLVRQRILVLSLLLSLPDNASSK